jgi:cyclin T
MTLAEESSKRRRTCRFIEEAGRVLKLPRVAVSTAMLFFHRFYAKHSFQHHDRFEVAMAAIVLAGKTEESPRKLTLVLDECYKLKLRGLQAGGALEAGPITSLDPKSEEYVKLKERVLLLERVILHTIGFELSVDHPYKFIFDQVKLLVDKRLVEYTTSPAGSESSAKSLPELKTDMVQCAMNFTNDSMHTTLCLQFTPLQIATATVYLAGQFKGIKPTSAGKDWLTILGNPDLGALASISLQIVELISERKGSNQAALQQIRVDIERLKEQLNEDGGSKDKVVGVE